jgi:transcription-repair coupling factor (superfamily II helicase)
VFWEEDQVESIRVFEPATQRTADVLDELVLAPVSTTGEAPLSDWLEGFEWADFAEGKLPSADGYFANPRFQGNLQLAVKQARDWMSQGWKVLLYSLNRGEDERLQETLEGRLEGVQFLTGPLARGFNHPDRKLAVLTSSEIYERSYRARARWAAQPKATLRWRDLKSGDYVVHGDYGIARYEGLRPVPVGSVSNLTASQLAEEDVPKQELILLEFRGGDKLFVPLWEFRKVQRYIGAGGRHPRLSSLDTQSWATVQGKVREGVKELAEELLKLEAARAAKPGYAFAPESHLEREFADSFPYEETPDQARTLQEVYRDMERPTPMNRVVIGDVGFGKTEIAMRAALKCVVGGRQAAILVPTTILAD